MRWAAVALVGVLGCAAPTSPDAASTVEGLAPPSASPGRLVRTHFAMGTLVRLVIALPDEVTTPGTTARAEAAIVEAFAAMDRVVDHMSEWSDSSDIGRVNASAGHGPVTVDPSVIAVLDAGAIVSERSGGAFDVTWAAMRGLWRFDVEHPGLPDADALEAARRRVDYRQVLVDRDAMTVELPAAGMAIGLGGIAKGYAIARAAESLQAAGFADFLIDAGGDLYARGSDHGAPWRVGVAHPRHTGELVATVALDGRALVTSGDYQRYFELGGVRYHHIIDVRTGFPARGWISVSVLCEDPMLADALSTAAFVLGPTGVEFIEAWPGADALFIDEALNSFRTSGWPSDDGAR